VDADDELGRTDYIKYRRLQIYYYPQMFFLFDSALKLNQRYAIQKLTETLLVTPCGSIDLSRHMY
jgi:hypothetical protein